MKKLIFALMVIALLAAPVAAFACHTTLEISDNECGPVTITGTYTDDDQLFKGVRIFVDGVKVAENGAWTVSEALKYSISTSYTITAPGYHSIEVRGYDRAAMVIVDQRTYGSVTVETCYQSCQKGNVEEYYCTDPVLNTETLLYEWTCKTRDIKTQEPCGNVDHNSAYVECTDTKEVHNKKETKLVDIYTGAVCKIVDTECTKDMYMQATFEKEGMPNCYLVSWDGYPAATQSQLCNCGWIADNMSHFGMVEYNSCANEYVYDGEMWPWFKEEMLEPHWGDGACLNVGGCG